jgi:hypothetical protein
MQEQIPSNGYAQFGFTIFTKYLEQVGISLPSTLSYLFSGGLFLVMLIILIFLNRKLDFMKGHGEKTFGNLYLVVSTVFVSCYLTGLSYDPRLIYMSIAGFLLVMSIDPGSIRKCLIGLLLSASLLSCGIELGFIPGGYIGVHPVRVIQLINDLTIQIFAVIFCLSLSQWCIKQLRTQAKRL